MPRFHTNVCNLSFSRSAMSAVTDSAGAYAQRMRARIRTGCVCARVRRHTYAGMRTRAYVRIRTGCVWVRAHDRLSSQAYPPWERCGGLRKRERAHDAGMQVGTRSSNSDECSCGYAPDRISRCDNSQELVSSKIELSNRALSQKRNRIQSRKY